MYCTLVYNANSMENKAGCSVMRKDFSQWHAKKSNLHSSVERRVYFNEREVWWCSLGANIGYEQDGKGTDFMRPIVVLKQFNKEVFWAVPLTTQSKVGKYYFPVDLGDGRVRQIILSQMRLADAKRLKKKLAVVSLDQFRELRKAIIALLQ